MLLRFMSANEALRLVQGQSLTNDTRHADNGWHTNSVGFCFVIVKEHEPTGMYDSARNLSGIVTMDVCLVGNLKAKRPLDNFRETHGRYRNGDIAEMSASVYGLSDFKDWRMYTPELPASDNPFKVISSASWLNPVLTTSSIVKS